MTSTRAGFLGHDALLALAREPLESARVERKARLSPSATKKVRQTICAFANDLPNYRKPGVIIIGQEDDGRPSGSPITDKLLNQLNNLSTDGSIVPKPTVLIERLPLDGAEIAVMQVLPHPAPPVELNREVWVRTGAGVERATPAHEQQLIERRRARDLPFDASPLYGARLTDIDLTRFREGYLPQAVSRQVLAENHRSELHQLMALRMVAPEAPDHPTALAVLLFADAPSFFIPGAYVDFIRFSGTTLADPIRDQRRFDGPLPDVLRLLEQKIELHIEQRVDLSADLETRRPDYPLVALRELVRNAVMHRDYAHSNAPVRVRWFDDRIEIDNPGGPYGQVTRENFGQGVTDYRNPNLAAALVHLRFVQRFGVGLEIARKKLEDNGNPPPEYLPEAGRVLVRLGPVDG